MEAYTGYTEEDLKDCIVKMYVQRLNWGASSLSHPHLTDAWTCILFRGRHVSQVVTALSGRRLDAVKRKYAAGCFFAISKVRRLPKRHWLFILVLMFQHTSA